MGIDMKLSFYLEILKLTTKTRMNLTEIIENLILITGILLFIGYPAYALGKKPPQSHKTIYTTVYNFIHEHYRSNPDVDITIKHLDKRLVLPSCSTELNAFWAPGSLKYGKSSIGVACNSEHDNWKIYVSADVKIYKPILVAKHTINRDALLSSNDVELIKRDISEAHYGYITSLNQFAGHTANRLIRTGEIISPQLLSPPKLIKRGEKVILLSQSAGLEVRMSGQAISDGFAGDIIKIRNTSSKKIIEGKVVAEGVVEVQM